MKKNLLVALLVCLSTVCQAITSFRFPNHEMKFFYAGERDEGPTEKEKAIRDLIYTSLSQLNAFSVIELSKRLGPGGRLPDEFYFPSYYYAGITLSNPQVNGEPKFYFFPIGGDYGLVVCQLSGNPSISGAAIYFHKERVDEKATLDSDTIRSILSSIHDRIAATEQNAAGQPAPRAESK